MTPAFPDPQTCRAVREGLAAAGFTEERVHIALTVPVGASPRALGPLVLEGRIDRQPDPLRTLLHLFLADRELDAGALGRGVGDGLADALHRSGLVEEIDGRCRPTVQLTVLPGLVVASDRIERHKARAADFVLGTGGVTRRLADFTLREPVDSALDLGCGAGTLGALAAAHARRVVATDVNPRAVAFSRFNAELNGLDHLECREGSLFEPVAGERFDLIVSNPPYVISPGSTFIYRDGGTAVCRALVRGAPDHLTDHGWLQMMAEWPEAPAGDWTAEVRSWLDGVPCDAWVLRLHSHPAAVYAWRWVLQEGQTEEERAAVFAAWSAYLRDQGIGAVGGGLVLLRPSTGSTPVRAFRDAPPVAQGPVGSSLGRWLAAQTLLHGTPSDQALADTPMVASPELVRVETRRTAGGDQGWSPPTSYLRLDGGLGFSARVDEVAVALVGLLAEAGTPRRATELFALRHGVSAESFVEGLPRLLRRLLSLGILLPRGDDAPRD